MLRATALSRRPTRCSSRRHARRKYSLRTGDLGLAVYLHSCLEVDDVFPTLDVS